MARGKEAPVGTKRTSPNGYEYTKTETGWRLSHHLVAEKKLGRPLARDERVKFKTKDKTNLSPDNIEVIIKGKSSLRRRKAMIEARIEELKAELAYIDRELKSEKLR